MSFAQEPSNLRLKILAGPNAGAETVLPYEDQRIGNGDFADLILQDDLVASEHICLMWKQDQLVLVPLAFPVYINGRPIKSEYVIDLYDVVTLGNSSFCLGSTTEEWPTIRLPRIRELREPSNSVEEPSGVAERLKQLANDAVNEPSSIGTPYRIGFLGGILLLVLALGVGFWAGKEAPKFQSHDQESLTQLVQQQGMDAVTVTALDSGEFVAQGYVDSAKDFAHLNKLFLAEGADVLNNVVAADLVQSKVQGILESMGYSYLNSEMVTPFHGTLGLRGVVSDEASLKRVSEALIHDVAGLSHVDSARVVTFPMAADDLRAMLSEKNLVPLLQVSVDSQQVAIEGQVADKDRGAYEQVLAVFFEKYGTYPSLKTAVAAQEKAIFDVQIKSISVGVSPYFTTVDGRKFMKGGRLNGYTVDRIAANKIVFVRGRDVVNYEL